MASRMLMLFAHIRENFANAFLPRLSEWACAGTMAGLGVTLTVNETLMQHEKEGYELLLSVADQSDWSRMMVLLGCTRLLVLLINGAWSRSPWGRAITAGLCCFFWTQIMLSFSPVMGYAFTMSAGWLVLELANVFRAMRDASTVDTELKRRRDYQEKDQNRRVELGDRG